LIHFSSPVLLLIENTMTTKTPFLCRNSTYFSFFRSAEGTANFKLFRFEMLERMRRYPFLLLSACLGVRGTPTLQYLPKLEAFRESPDAWSSITRASGETVDVIGENDIIPELNGKAICHFVEMNRYSMPVGEGALVTFPSTYPLESLVAVVLAMEHLNTGDGSVVPEIEGLDRRCIIRFTAEFVDTQGSEAVAVDKVINITSRSSVASPEQQEPCAFQGAFRSKVNIASALYSSLKGYPQVSTLTSLPELGNKEIYPLYGSLSPADAALPFLQFLVDELRINHLAIIHADTADSIGRYVNPLQEAAARYYPGQMVIHPVSYPDRTADYSNAIKLLKETGVRYVYSVADTNHFEPLILEAHKNGIVGVPPNGGEPTHTWISWVGIATTFLLRKEFVSDDPMLMASKGMLILDTTIRSIPGVGRYNEFIEARSKLANPEDLAYLQTKIPKHTNQPGYNPIIANETVSGIGRFTGTSSVLYDATIALGLGACAAANVYNSSIHSAFDGATHYQGFLNETFVGASGVVKLDPSTGFRDATANLYGMSNMVPLSIDGGANLTFIEIQTHYYDMGKWNQIANITFADGRKKAHPALPPVEIETHTIGVGLRSIGIAMGVLVVLASFGCAVWTVSYRKTRIVTASQPVFLLLICLGTLLMGTSIFPISLDDEVVATPEGADKFLHLSPFWASVASL